MAETPKRRGAPRGLRAVIPVLVVAGVAFAIWKYATRREDYQGGDIRTTGTVEAVHVDLGFKVAGRLAEVPVSEGEELKAGQLVARLEPQDLQVQERSASSACEAARASLAEARAAQAQTRANAEKAARDLDRTRSLMRDGATTPQALDAASAAADASRAQVQAADAQVEAAQAQVHQAESALAQADLQLSYAELETPEGGTVSEKVHRPGEMVMVGTPVVTVAHMDTVKVHAPVDETRIGAVRPGDPVNVRVYTFDRQEFSGVVTDVQPAGDFATRKDWGAQRRDIRTYTVTAAVPNPQHLLKDGMTAEVTIRVSPDVQRMAGAGR